MRKPNDAFEALRDANPVDESALPGPESPKARALLAEITSTPRIRPAPPARRSRRLAVIIAIVLLALASIAAAWLVLRDVTDPISVTCYREGRLGGDIAAVTSGGPLDVNLCDREWEDRILTNEAIVPAGQIPPLVGCVTDRGNLAVFPSDDPGLCAQLGLAEPDPASIPQGNQLRQLSDDLVAHFDAQECQPLPDAERDVRAILDSYGFDDWQIQSSPTRPSRPCASFSLDPATQIIHLVPIPPPD